MASYDPRWGDDPRDRDDNSRDLSRGSRGSSDPRDRERVDPRDVFMEHVNLPRGLEREHVHYHGHDYTLRGSETRTLTTVGAFRAVPAHDLRDRFDQPLDPRHGELWHLRDSGLVQTVRLDRDHTVVTLTKEGCGLLESRRLDEDSRDLQAFHNGVQKPRELKHDAELYRAYMEEAERLRDEGANIHRIVLENDLKSEYQEFLQERNRDRDDSDGRPDRDPLEIQEWAREHELPCDDQGHVQFPHLRIEYDVDGRDHTLDVEVMTPHYRGAHAAAKSGSGFRLYFSARTGGGRGQYARFCGIVYGAKTRKFFDKLVRLIGQRAKQIVWNQLMTPLKTDILEELRWYFEQVRSHPTPSRNDDLDERFYEARAVFSAPRFKALYRAWKQDGELVLTFAGSRAISDTVNAGAGRVESLELGHRYGHLSPLVAVA